MESRSALQQGSSLAPAGDAEGTEKLLVMANVRQSLWDG